MRLFAHIAIATLVLFPSLVVPASCRALLGEAGETASMQAGAESCCGDACKCAANSSDGPACGTSCARAPVASTDDTSRSATLPEPKRDDGKPLATLASASLGLTPVHPTVAESSSPTTTREATDPPGKLRLTLCRFLI